MSLHFAGVTDCAICYSFVPASLPSYPISSVLLAFHILTRPFSDLPPSSSPSPTEPSRTERARPVPTSSTRRVCTRSVSFPSRSLASPSRLLTSFVPASCACVLSTVVQHLALFFVPAVQVVVLDIGSSSSPPLSFPSPPPPPQLFSSSICSSLGNCISSPSGI